MQNILKKRFYYYSFIFVSTWLLTACCFDCDGNHLDNRSEVECEKYKFLTFDALKESVDIVEASEIIKSGKIYMYGTMLLVNEVNRGIHIIDNTDKNNPINKAFIKLWGNLDIAVKDGYLYADSFTNLFVFNIKDIDNIVKVTKKENVFPKNLYQVIDRDDYNFWYSPKCGFDSDTGMIVEVRDE